MDDEPHRGSHATGCTWRTSEHEQRDGTDLVTATQEESETVDVEHFETWTARVLLTPP